MRCIYKLLISKKGSQNILKPENKIFKQDTRPQVSTQAIQNATFTGSDVFSTVKFNAFWS